MEGQGQSQQHLVKARCSSCHLMHLIKDPSHKQKDYNIIIKLEDCWACELDFATGPYKSGEKWQGSKTAIHSKCDFWWIQRDLIFLYEILHIRYSCFHTTIVHRAQTFWRFIEPHLIHWTSSFYSVGRLWEWVSRMCHTSLMTSTLKASLVC